jgi:hypothetical protein
VGARAKRNWDLTLRPIVAGEFDYELELENRMDSANTEVLPSTPEYSLVLLSTQEYSGVLRSTPEYS